MSNKKASVLIASLICAASVNCALGDALALSDGRVLRGTVLQTNDANVVLQADFGTLSYPRATIKAISINKAGTLERAEAARLPNHENLILLLSKQPWASNLKQIPATVIGLGILRNVPYISYRCGENYEVNIYGDPDAPAGIEVGAYRKLLDSAEAKQNCLRFVAAVLSQPGDKYILQSLKVEKDEKTYDGLTFEITPPTAEDAYQGWWISVYSKQKLDVARASDEEMKQISVAKAEVTAKTSQTGDVFSWSPDEMKLARPVQTNTITFTNSSGEVVTEAEVVRVVDGSSLIWRKGVSGGTVKLADLPEDMRLRFGYDPSKAAAADAADRERRLVAAQTAQATQPTKQGTVQSASSDYLPYLAPSSGSGGGGSVYVRGYTRKDGTYVNGYTRRRPN
jgi:hypothetical protein